MIVSSNVEIHCAHHAIGRQRGGPCFNITRHHSFVSHFKPVVTQLAFLATQRSQHTHAIQPVLNGQAGKRSEFARQRRLDLPVNVSIDQYEQDCQRDGEHCHVQ
jgi:hypothetical protein